VNVLAFDPGFDDTGWAVFSLVRPPGTLNEAVKRLRDSGTISTRPELADADRLFSLGLRVRNLIVEWDPVVAYVELPSFEGSYTGGKERRRGVNRLYMALGAILCRLHSGLVVGVPAIRSPKETRHQLLRHAAGVEGIDLPEGPRGGVREDEWDAIWLGASALLERGARDLPLPGRTPVGVH
jgi:hypothetical protein